MNWRKIGPVRWYFQQQAARKIRTALMPVLQELKKMLIEQEERFEALGNYERRLDKKTISASKMPLNEIVIFFSYMSEAARKVQAFQDTERILPIDLSKKNALQETYLDLVEKYIFRGGKGSPHSMNRTPDGQKVEARHIYLGNVHGIWTKDVSWILGCWPLEGKDDAIEIYTTQAWRFVKSYFEAVSLITKLEAALN